MKTKTLVLCVALLAGVSAWADEVKNYNVYDDCSKNGYIGVENGYEWIDLGLPSGLKWASCNIGAEQPDAFGNYYAWGEVEPKETYTWVNYKYAKGSSTTLTKYCSRADLGYNGFTDNKTTLESEDDAAHVNLGGNWRTPTKVEFEELNTNCTWESAMQNGVRGALVTSQTNGNSIFLPGTGLYTQNGHLYVDSTGYYLSSVNAYEGYSWSNSAYFFGVKNGVQRGIVPWSRNFGATVRAVCPLSSTSTSTPTATASNASSYVTLTLNTDGCGSANVIKCNVGQQVQVTAVPNGSRYFTKWSDGNTSNPRTITVDKAMTLTAVFADTPTAIDNTSADTTPRKVLIDGQVLILRNGRTYTLTGQEVK